MTEYYRDVLANGLRVVTVEMPHLHSAEMQCYIGVGGRCEQPEQAGLSHFLEHMLFRGTPEHPSSLDLDRAFEALGGAVNASTDAETTCYHSRLHPERIAEGAALFAAMLRHPLLSGLEVERRIVLEEALEDYNEHGEEINPDTLTGRLLWPGHPLSQPTIGTRASITAFDEAALRWHLGRYYTPGNCVVVVAGRVRREQVLAAVEAAFSGWAGTSPPAPIPFNAPICGTAESAWVRDSDSQIAIQLAFRLPGRNHPDTLPLRILRRILSGSGAARLMLRLRETLGLTYNVEANLALFADSGCLAIDLAVAPGNLVAAVQETLAVVAELRETVVGADELDRVVGGYLYDLDFSRDHADDLAARYGWGELVGCLRTIEEDRRELTAVTAATLREVAHRHLQPDGLKGAFVGPFRKRDRATVEQLLAGFGRGV